ncbi:hypothetical protein PILCRDRAFT_10786, partial [Piloderma croceum F 1598]
MSVSIEAWPRSPILSTPHSVEQNLFADPHVPVHPSSFGIGSRELTLTFDFNAKLMPSQKKVARALKGRMRDPPIRQQDDEHEDIPDPQTRTKEWLTITDKICKQWFDPLIPLPLSPVVFRGRTRTQGTLLACVADDQDLLHEVALNRHVICFAQLQISRTVTTLFTEYDFEEEWPKLDEDAQEKYMLDA